MSDQKHIASFVLPSEVNAANKMDQYTEVLLPAKKEQYEKLASFGLVFIEAEDNVLARFSLPGNLKLVMIRDDPRHQSMIDLNQNNKSIFTVFLKKTVYEYTGYLCF